jgi:hypothetical protein
VMFKRIWHWIWYGIPDADTLLSISRGEETVIKWECGKCYTPNHVKVIITKD